MKYLRLFLILCVSFPLIGQVQNYVVGDVVDDFTVTDIDGNVHNLYNYTAGNRWVFIDFFFDTCVPCQESVSIFNEFYDKYGCNSGDLIMITINNGSDTNAEVRAFKDEFGGPFHHAPAVGAEGGAGAVAANFNPAAYPSYVLISPGNALVDPGIWPVLSVEDFEAVLPFDPVPAECTLGLDDAVQVVDFSLAPNPSVRGSFKLNLSQPEGQIRIYSVMGQLVYSEEISGTNMDIEANLSAGSYFVQVHSTWGSNIKTLIVQ